MFYDRLTLVADWDGGVATYAYDAAGQLIITTMPNGVVSVNAYDRAGRQVALTHTASSGIVLSAFRYQLDGVGNRVSVEEVLTSTMRTITYTYDPLNRLTEAEYDDGKLFQYAYDAVGNRTRYTETLTQTAVTTYAYDAANRLTQVGDTSYTWDNNGNLTNDGLFTYTWDSAGRLVQARSISHTVVYTYNGDGVRVAQLADDTLAVWVQDVAAGLPLVLVEVVNTEAALYLYGLGHLAQIKNGHGEWFLGDALGSVRQLVDGGSDVVLSRDYDPYGEVIAESGTGSTGYGFTGEQHDTYTGLVFLRARYYAPQAGVFLSYDPVMWGHPYAYAGSNP